MTGIQWMVRRWVLVHCGCQKLTHASTLDTLNEDKKERVCACFFYRNIKYIYNLNSAIQFFNVVGGEIIYNNI
jgi:hypothetical protein